MNRQPVAFTEQAGPLMSFRRDPTTDRFIVLPALQKSTPWNLCLIGLASLRRSITHAQFSLGTRCSCCKATGLLLMAGSRIHRLRFFGKWWANLPLISIRFEEKVMVSFMMISRLLSYHPLDYARAILGHAILDRNHIIGLSGVHRRQELFGK
jgi:hypothetical protein